MGVLITGMVWPYQGTHLPSNGELWPKQSKWGRWGREQRSWLGEGLEKEYHRKLISPAVSSGQLLSPFKVGSVRNGGCWELGKE